MTEKGAREALEQADAELLNPWEQQPGESEKAFHAFAAYRDELHKRTYESVAHKLHCTGSNVRRWAAAWHWRDRTRAYDNMLDEQDRVAAVHERREMRKRQARMGVNLQSLAAIGLAELNRRVELQLPLDLDAQAIARLVDIGAKVERIARGEDAAGQYTKINVIIGDATDESIAEELANL